MFYWLLLKVVPTGSIPSSWPHDALVRSSPAKWFLFSYWQMLIHQNDNDYNVLWKEFKADKKLQCPLDGIQNRKESKWTFAGNLSDFLCLVSQHPVVWLLKEARAWSTGSAGSPVLRQAHPQWVPLFKAKMYPLSWGWRAQRRVGPPGPPDWGKRGVTCLKHVSVNKEIQMCTAKFWPTIRFFFLNRLHSLMQNTFFYGELGMEFWKWNTGFCLLWHKKSIHVKPPQVEIGSPSIPPGLCSVIHLHIRNGKRWYSNILHSDAILLSAG